MELLISGSFSDKEISELQEQLKTRNIDVYRYIIKSYETEEIIRFFFRDLDAFKLLRDGVLFSVLQWAVGKGITWVKQKKPNAKITVGADLRFEKKDKKIAPINIGLPSESEKAWKELEKSVTTQFIEFLDGSEIVNVYWDEKEKKIKIQRMKI